jgi:hypothetical protein
MEKQICQSCGMPLTNEKLIATEKDGTLNHEYCLYCYQNGSFTEPNITMQKMANICVYYMTNKESGFDESIAHEMMNNLLPTLNRWK